MRQLCGLTLRSAYGGYSAREWNSLATEGQQPPAQGSTNAALAFPPNPAWSPRELWATAGNQRGCNRQQKKCVTSHLKHKLKDIRNCLSSSASFWLLTLTSELCAK